MIDKALLRLLGGNKKYIAFCVGLMVLGAVCECRHHCIAYLQDNGLTDYEQLEQKATAATERFHKLSDQIKSTEAALHTNMELKAATVQYAKTRPTFEKYKASKYSKKFLAEHEADRAWGTVYKLCKIFLRLTFLPLSCA